MTYIVNESCIRYKIMDCVEVCLKVAELSPAETNRILQDCLEDRFQVSRRRTDDFKHLGGRGLLL